MTRYEVLSHVHRDGSAIKLNQRCYDLTMINRGADSVKILDITLAQNEELRISGNIGEYITGNYEPRFLGSTKELVILQRVHVNN